MSERLGEHVRLERDGRVATVTYDRSDGLNALSRQGMRELREAARHLAADTALSAIVLTGAGVFSAGADLKDPENAGSRGGDLVARREALKIGPDLCQAWADLEVITIAAVERFCIGGGVALALACDHRIAARNAHFRLPEVPLGMNMSWRTNPRTVALMGPSRAKRFTILGERLEAETALEWGLVDAVTEPGGALDAARALAHRYAGVPPLALRMTKQAIDIAAQPLGHATSFMYRDQFLLTEQGGEQAAAIAAFLKTRADGEDEA